MLEDYRNHIKHRDEQNIPPKPLSSEQVSQLIKLLEHPQKNEEETLFNLIANHVPPGVDEAAYIKANFLTEIINENISSTIINKKNAIKLLGNMHGGYNVKTLINILDDESLAKLASDELKNTILIFDAFHDIEEKAKNGNKYAKDIIQSWADAEWFTKRTKLPNSIKAIVFKVTGETNTDDLSPAQDAWSRPDIPLHAQAMYKIKREGLEPNKSGVIGPINQIKKMQSKKYPIAFIGDVVGTGSSRKSATNSLLWFFGKEITGMPNKKNGGICIGDKIAPIFFNTMRDAGALIFEASVDKINMEDIIEILPYEEKILNEQGEIISTFQLKSKVLLDEIQAGGRINLIIGRALTAKARESLNLPIDNIFNIPKIPIKSNKGFSLAQKIVGRACSLEEGQGIRPGTYCEPIITTVGSQDTTGPMTRDELKDLACLGFSADLTMQSFCHTAAYPKPIDIDTQNTLPDFIRTRGGVSLKAGDGIIHSWLNRMLLPDTVGTGGDSHTRFPMGISFPAGSGLVAFAAATGVMPLDMPESILIRFKGEIQQGITLRDIVHSIPYYAIKAGHLTIEKKGKKNIFSGRIIEIEGIKNLSVEQAFELSDASAERSAAACTIKLEKNKISEYLNSNIILLRSMIANGYGDIRTLERRAQKMENWLINQDLIEGDSDAEYIEIIEIDLNEIKEPIVCVPNDPDNAKLLSEVAGCKIDEVFIGSCMTNIGHFRAAGNLLKNQNDNLSTRLWLAPPTKMDEQQLMEEGYYNIFGKVGARIEMPGCSLCMGNQARVKANSTILSTSTRNFPNRLGDNANVYLTSAELASVGAILGKIPTHNEYIDYVKNLNTQASEIYQYLNFDKMTKFQKLAKEGAKIAALQIDEIR